MDSKFFNKQLNIMVKETLKNSIVSLVAGFLLFTFDVNAQILLPPQLSSPANGSTNLSLPVTVSWSHSTATSYRLQVATNASFSNLIVDQSGITNTNYQLTDLTHNTTYYWRVKAFLTLVESNWSAEWNFTTAGQLVPAPPVLVSPPSGSSIATLTPELTWAPSQNAETYRLQVSRNPSFNPNVIVYDNTSITTTSEQVGPLEYDLQYYWRVNASNSAGTSDWSSVWNFKTLPDPNILLPPVLTLPVNGATNIPVNPNIIWEISNGAESYHLQVSTSSTFSTNVVDVEGLTSTTYNVTGLSNNTQYFWRVNASNASGTSNWSSVWNFTTEAAPPPVPPPPELVSPSNGSTGIPVNQDLSWQVSNGAESYRLQVSANSTFVTTTVDVSGLTATTYNVNGLTHNSQYYWRVNASNTSGTSNWSSVWNFTTEAAPPVVPPPPILISPLNGATDVPIRPILSWQNSPGAESYRLQVSTDPEFSILILDQDQIISTSFDAGELLPGTLFYWHVNASNTSGTSDWSETRNFTTTSDPSSLLPPELISPANGATNVPVDPIFSWQSTVGAIYYRLQISTSSSFSTLAVDQSGITSTSYGVTGLLESTVYYWRVNASTLVLVSDWSEVWSFTTEAGGGGGNLPSPPNLISPANGTTNESNHPILVWSQVSNTNSYRLQVANDVSFNNPVFDLSSIPANYHQVGPLEFSKTYYWRVISMNTAGNSNWSVIWNFTTRNNDNLIPEMISPSDGAQNLPLSVLCTWNHVQNAAMYHIKVSTQPNFGSNFFDDLTAGNSIQVSNLSSNRIYFWKVRAKVNNKWEQFAAPWQFSTRSGTPVYTEISTTIFFPLHNDLNNYKSSDYKIIGIPGASPIEVTEFLPGAEGEEWQVYWDNGNPNNYLVSYNNYDFFFSTGKAFWIIKKGAMQIDATVEEAPVNSKGNVEIPVHRGWNLITNPLLTPVSWDSVRGLNGIAEPIYTFDQTYSISELLNPYTGYYFFNPEDISTLEIPTESSTSRPGAGYTQNLLSKPGKDDWDVKIKLTVNDYVDSIAWFGVSSKVSEKVNPLNIRKPRSWGDLPSVYFHRPEWDKDYPYFANDIKPALGQFYEWSFEIRSFAWNTAVLSFSLTEIPGHLEIYLIDNKAKKWVNVRQSPTYRFTPATGTTTFTVMAGNKNIIENKLNDAGPKEYKLGDNFPNPFNLSTTIPISVPETKDLRITIFNVLGNRIKLLHQGILEAGEHWFRWDGTDDRGSVAPSGVYLYQLSDDFQLNFLKKMTLVK